MDHISSEHAESNHSRPDTNNRHLDGNGETGRRRARIACTRCRRLRKKCIHQKAQVPCLGCREAGSGTSAECRFPVRGEPDYDRNFRRPRAVHSQSIEGLPQITASQQDTPFSAASDSRIPTQASLSAACSEEPPLAATDRWYLLPPLNEVVDACKIFGTSFFQLGFLPKAIFLEQLSNHPSSINVFFLLGILSVSARFTPCLIARYGDGLKAAEIFMERAARLVPEEMYSPTLERIQAFFLLAIAEWGKGDKTASNIHMGIAVRMAGILRLHREETYALSEDSTAEDAINVEMARRTFWMLESQDNLHSGYTTPVSFSLGDITAFLPCEERDFSFGLIPEERAALAGTSAATRNPAIVHTSSRSLFATLIQAHNLWGQVARGAVTSTGWQIGDSVDPWDSKSDYSRLLTSLKVWEEHLPARHKWSIWNFRGYKAEGLDLAYLSVVMVIRLSNIILRRSFMENIIRKEQDDTAPQDFWVGMSSELFENVLALHEQIDAFSSLRSPEQGFPAMIIFCVYVCGSLANHLWKRPEICPRLADGMEDITRKSLKILSDLQHPWQLARKWKIALEQRTLVTEPEVTVHRSVEHARTSRQPHIPSFIEVALNDTGAPGDKTPPHESQSQQVYGSNSPSSSRTATIPPDSHTSDLCDQEFDWSQQQPLPNGGFEAFNSSEDDIEAQLIAFLQVQGQLGMLYD
ncbi:hypothetical protein G7Y89_g3438 [Cudoniella acicularis]|uniref:Zn(2)-C6 fungal-type domain-containing protein n=1 Tax=Cudoniella acicularis TaxID=354080 RepID=A0A8H4W8D1_9HELO|nr:hypothetical protein G7Y89_g3438 [Cudoniella acicularis]